MVLDFAIRHQGTVIAIAGVLIAACVLWRAVKERQYLHLPSFELQPIDGALNTEFTFSRTTTIPSVHRATVTRGRRGLTVIGLLILAIFITAAKLRPVPPAIGLQLPEIIQTQPNNDALIIFLHGWNGGDVETWQSFPKFAQHDRRFTGHDLLIVNYPTYFIRRDLNITDLSEFVGRSLESDLGVFERYREITVIAHSMGGLVAREIAIQHALRRTPGRFTRLIEIATPHDGADVAGLAASLGISREAATDLARDSRFLAELRTHWANYSDQPHTICIGSPQDAVVSVASAHTDCKDRAAYPLWGHTEMVKPSSMRDYRYVVPTRYIS